MSIETLKFIKKILSHLMTGMFESKNIFWRIKRGGTLFRNDDVSFDTDTKHFMKFCAVFHQRGYSQIHGITLYGNTNCSYTDRSGNPLVYENEADISNLSYEKIKRLSKDIFIGNNKELINYLNSIPDAVALHGLYHTDYSKMSCEDQENDIAEGLSLLNKLFPHKVISIFIPPFNRINQDTKRICRKYNLGISALEGKHMEALINKKKCRIRKGELYRYHHHRFYPESTFSYYDLNFEKLDKFINQKQKFRLPPLRLVEEAVALFNTQSWYIYAFKDFKKRKHAHNAYKWIINHIGKDNSILETGCGLGGMLYFLWSKGYARLSGYDIDKAAIDVGNFLSNKTGASIDFMVSDGFSPILELKYDVIVGINWIYHVPGYSLELFVEKHLPYLTKTGYLIFDMIDSSYNKVENNQYLTSDWNKPVEKRRQSEYIVRYSKSDVVSIAERYGLRLAAIIDTDNNDVIPRKIYVLQEKSKCIWLLCDRPNWAFDFSAKEIANYLNDEYSIDIKYVENKPKLDESKFDLLHVFFWGETYQRKFKIQKNKILKEISSHRFEDNKLYGPCTPKEMAIKYLREAEHVFCTSERLFNMFSDIRRNVFLTENGYSNKLFYFKKERYGGMTICWAGNINDEVKGVKDILIPACGSEFTLNIASMLKHDKMVDFYNSNDILVVCSRNEAEPLPLIESMACGCFPVCCDVGIVPEIVRHKENGYIVAKRTPDAFREAFVWCRENIDFVREAGKKNADIMYKTKRWELMAEGFRKLYRACLEI
jgi:glycosyltransferase involved in cell wall biosynthesis